MKTFATLAARVRMRWCIWF